MNEGNVERVRVDAVRRGLALIEVGRQAANEDKGRLFKLIVPEQDFRIYPQGVGAEGAPLQEVEDWLSCPWE